METATADRRIIVALILGTLLLSTPSFAVCPPVAAKDVRPYWVTLPRGGAPTSPGELPYAPLPNPRAVERRAARGDAARISTLTRGPDPDAVRELASLASSVRFVSRWLSAVSLDLTPAQHVAVEDRFGEESVRPVLRFRRDDPDPPPEGMLFGSRPKAIAPLDYGPSVKQIEQIQVDQLHELGFTGHGVRVLVLDTGFLTSHEAFGQLAVVAEWDFVCGDDNTANEPCDDPSQHNHGTGVLGVLAGHTPGQLIGPAFRAEVLLAKTEDVRSETQVEEDNFVAALEWGEALGADLATASLGYVAFDDGSEYPPEAFDGNTAPTTIALDDLVAMGVVAVVAAGNRGPSPSSLLTPADADEGITVGSVDSVGVVSNFSSRGPTFDDRIKPDVATRGRLTVWVKASGGFGVANGTSLAAPLAAGAIALMLEAHPEWSPSQLRAALWATSTRSMAPDNDMGYGIVQAHDAMLHEDPIVPFPFELLEPADGSMGAGTGATFRWQPALDLQTPQEVEYTVHASSSEAFDDVLGVWFVGAETLRVIDPLPAGPFHWRVLAEDADGHVRVSQNRTFTPGDPTGHDGSPRGREWATLDLPRPNPFNPSVEVVVRSEREGRLLAEVVDVAGRRVRTLHLGPMTLGDVALRWDGRDESGREVASGVYLLRAEIAAAGVSPLILARRLVLLR